MNISHSLESISVPKLLNTIESSSVIKSLTSDNLFFKAALYLSIKPSNFVPGVNAAPAFTADIPSGPSKRSLSF